MGDTQPHQPLTPQDKVTVVLYRAGIVSATLCLVMGALRTHGLAGFVPPDLLFLGLFLSTGVSVFFIHLYIGRFHRGLKILYGISAAGVAGLYAAFGGIVAALASPYGPILLLPLAGCLGFLTAKEAFCFRLFEGYLLALLMPSLLLATVSGILSPAGAASALTVVAVLMTLFTSRKTFMPLHYDIGDKSAYQ